MNWMISASLKMYNAIEAFDEFKTIDWKQSANFTIGDYVYLYVTLPYKKVMFKTLVVQTNLTFNERQEDAHYWLNKEAYAQANDAKFARLILIERADNDMLELEQLKAHGLKAAPQGPIKLSDDLTNYINHYLDDYAIEEVFPEEVAPALEEGFRREVTVNRYERSSVARKKCIQHHGTSCKVCDLNFEEMYGEMGRGFIHVHHLTPLHEINATYKVNYIEDLIPVCPNCHAMLHKKVDGQLLTVDQLKEKIQENA